MTEQRLAITDFSGIAVFEFLTVLDCDIVQVDVKFKFYTGDNTDPSRYIISDSTTTTYQFVNEDEIILYSNYSRNIAAYQPFEVPLLAKIITPNIDLKSFILKVLIKQFDNKVVTDQAKFSARYLSGNTCNIEVEDDGVGGFNFDADVCKVWQASV